MQQQYEGYKDLADSLKSASSITEFRTQITIASRYNYHLQSSR